MAIAGCQVGMRVSVFLRAMLSAGYGHLHGGLGRDVHPHGHLGQSLFAIVAVDLGLDPAAGRLVSPLRQEESHTAVGKRVKVTVRDGRSHGTVAPVVGTGV